MALTNNDINIFTQRAQAAGYSASQIAAEIERKKKAEIASAGTSTQQKQPVQPEQTKTPALPKQQQTNANQPQQNTQQQKQPVDRNRQEGVAGFFEGIGDFLLPRSMDYMRKVISGTKLSMLLPEVEKADEALNAQSRRIAEQAKNETDPEKKKRLLELSRKIDLSRDSNVENLLKTFEEETGVDRNYSGQPSYAMEAVGVTGEAGSWLVGGAVGKFALGGKAGIAGAASTVGMAKGVNIATRILRPVVPGALSGGLYAGTTEEELTPRERLERIMSGATVGGAVSGGLKAATLPLKPISNFVKNNESRVYQLFKLNPAERAQFRKSTGDMNFAEEIIKRDAKNMVGKDYQGLLDYFTTRKDEAYKTVESTLKSSTKTIKRSAVLSMIDEKMSNLSSKNENVGQSGAISAFEQIKKDLTSGEKHTSIFLPKGKDLENVVKKTVPLSQRGEDISLEIANKIKRQLQDAGDAAFSSSGKSTPASKAYAEVSSYIKGLIEKEAPEIKDQNKLVQLYHAARAGIERTGDREANKVSNDIAQKFLQSFPAVVGSVGGATAIGGLPAAIATGTLGLLGASIMSGSVGAVRNKYLSPEVQTKLISWVGESAKRQGVKDPANIINALTAALGTGAQNTIINEFSQGKMKPEEAMAASQTIPTPDGDTGTLYEDNADDYENQMIEITNRETGEVRMVSRNELGQYGLGEDSVDGLPSKKAILAAMVKDLGDTGGKNLAELNTVLIAYEKVYGKDSELSAQEKSAVNEAMSGLNLVQTIEDLYGELQSYGLTAQSGGIVERARGQISGSIATLQQEGDRGAAAAAYTDTVQAFLSKLARASGEKGVLTDYDIKRIEKAIPGFSDAPDTASRKITIIKGIISSAIESKKKNPLGDDKEDEDLSM